MAGILVNGTPRDLEGVPLHTNALDFLRGCGLTGAKEGCAEGECGACSVLVARPAPDGSEATEWTAINSCLVPAATLDGQEVVTSEGLGSPGSLHPVQHEMAVRGGSQCGYCTPGFVCSMAAEFYRSGRAATNGTAPHDDELPRGQRLRPARDQRQPVPLHRLPADQGRRVRARLPGRGRRAGRQAYDARAGARRDPAGRRRGDVPPAGDARRRAAGARRRPRRRGRRRQHRLGRRGQPQGRPRAGRGRGRPAARAARLHGLRRRDPDRRRADPDRGRAPARRPAADPGRADAAVRLAADPQRRHARRQPRHRLADRRRAAGAARPRGVAGPRRRRTGSGPCRWRTTSPATASRSGSRAS